MAKAELKYYEFEYLSSRLNKVCSTIVRAYSIASAIYVFNRSDEILSIKLLTDKDELDSNGQEIKDPDITELAEKIERNEKRINDLEVKFKRLNTRLNELWARQRRF